MRMIELKTLLALCLQSLFMFPLRWEGRDTPYAER